MVVYTSKTCAPCTSLKRFLDHKGYDYRILDIDDDAEHLVNLLKITGRKIVPTTIIEGHQPIVGLNYSAINKAMQ